MSSDKRKSDTRPSAVPKRRRLGVMNGIHLQALKNKKAVVVLLCEAAGEKREFAVALDRETAVNLHHALGDWVTLLGKRWHVGWASDPLLLPDAVFEGYRVSGGDRDATSGFFDAWGVRGLSVPSARALADFLYIAAREALAQTIDLSCYPVGLVVVSPDEFSCRDGAIITPSLFNGLTRAVRESVHYHGALDLLRHAHLLERGGDKALNFEEDGMVLFQWLRREAAHQYQEKLCGWAKGGDLAAGRLYDEQEMGTRYRLATLFYDPKKECHLRAMVFSNDAYGCLERHLVGWNQHALDDCRWRITKGMPFECTLVLNDRFSSLLNPEFGGAGTEEEQEFFDLVALLVTKHAQ